VPARVVLACWGSFGDLFPTLAVAAALKARGHQPVVATCPVYRDIVAREGLEFAPARPDVDPFDTALMARVMDPARGSEVIVRELLVPALRDSYADLDAAAQGADLLVSHPVTFAAPLVAARRRLPWLSTVLAPMSFFSITDFPLLPPFPQALRLARTTPWAARAFMGLARSVTRAWTAPIRAFRAELGLPEAGDALYEGQFSPHGTLALFSRVMAEPQADWPPRTTTTGFVFFDGYAAQLGDEVRAFLNAGEPPVVFTLGTSAVSTPGDFYRESAAAAVAMGRRAILLIGRHPENRPPILPASVLAADYAPHAALFARAAAIVHQGGAGTTAQALRAGRPMLVVPHAHDQPDNAARVERLGVARVLPPGRYRAARVKRDVTALIDDPDYRANAEAAAAVVRGERGAEAACDAIEGLLADTR
jgi:UDP:flavonoid glycosyltransferase YjiC (YdhE family)